MLPPMLVSDFIRPLQLIGIHGFMENMHLYFLYFLLPFEIFASQQI